MQGYIESEWQMLKLRAGYKVTQHWTDGCISIFTNGVCDPHVHVHVCVW